MKKTTYTKVLLTQLIPFSGRMYNENGTEVTNISGNPFYVPEDYMDNDKTDAESISLRQLHASIEHDGIMTSLLVRPTESAKREEKDSITPAGPDESNSINSKDSAISTVDASVSIETDGGNSSNNSNGTNADVYELLSGYRRKRVREKLSEMKKAKAKFQKVPVIILDCDDDEASLIMTFSNVQRKKSNLLDTIQSCGRMYRAMKHRRKDKKRPILSRKSRG